MDFLLDPTLSGNSKSLIAFVLDQGPLTTNRQIGEYFGWSVSTVKRAYRGAKRYLRSTQKITRKGSVRRTYPRGGVKYDRGARYDTPSTVQDSTVPSPTLPPTVPLPSPDDFSEIWIVCPRGPKAKALDQYMLAVPHLVTHEQLLSAWKSTVVEASEPQFVPHLFRWIRDERWEEAQAKTTRPKAELTFGGVGRIMR